MCVPSEDLSIQKICILLIAVSTARDVKDYITFKSKFGLDDLSNFYTC